jgi:hypothetical protein
MDRVHAGALALTVTVMLVVAPSAFGASTAPIKIGTNGASTPTQPAVAVDSSGTAYVAWIAPGTNATQMEFCKVAIGATGCSPVTLPGPAGGTLFDPPSVVLSGSTVAVFESVFGATNNDQNGTAEWVSSDGGQTFTLLPSAVFFIGGNSSGTVNPVIALPGGNVGYGAVVPGGNPGFQANTLASPSDYSVSTTPPYATLNAPGNSYQVGNLGGEFAAGPAGILGVFALIEAGPCPQSEGLVSSFAALPATNAALNTSSTWSPLAGVDCNTQYPAVAGGPSGLGLLENNDATLSNTIEQYRKFTPPSSFSAPITVAHTAGISPSLSQDGSGHIFATWISDSAVQFAFSGDGGSSWVSKTLVGNSGTASPGALTSAVASGGQGWAVFASSGTEWAQPFDKTAVLPPAPTNTRRPTITGKPKAGSTLRCSTGSWTGSPNAYGYQWSRNGVPLAGSTRSTYTVQTLDEGTTLSCVVGATNAGGTTSANGNSVKVPIPYVPKCPGATGRISGTKLGLAKIGMTRGRAHYLYRFHSDRGKQYQDFFCLTPIGVRVGYASPKLTRTLPRRLRRQVAGKVVWISTSNPFYSLSRVRPGESLAIAATKLRLEPPFHIGPNYWYLSRSKTVTAVLKVRHGVVEELGIGDNALTTTRAEQGVLMRSFY